MSRFLRTLSCLPLALTAATAPIAAQDVASIQVTPSDLSLVVDSSEIVFALPYDGRGVPLQGIEITWSSSNLSVARVEPDPGQPTATVIAVAPGIAQIEARVGSVVQTVIVQVTARPQVAQPEAEPAPVEPTPEPDSILAGDISSAAMQLVARIEPHNFGFAQPCRVGAFVAGNLLLTSYVAIRGADSLNVVLPTGDRVSQGVRIAAYDRQADVAVLHVPVQRTGAMTIGQNPAQTDYVWVVGQPNCQGTQTAPAQVGEAGAPGLLTLDREFGLGQLGAPVINQDGELVGLAAGGSGAVRASSVSLVFTQARRNLAAGSLLSASQVARAEQHAFGSISVRSDIVGSVARITPLEDWHWPELGQQSTLPLNFGGPMGRYLIELLSAGAVQSTTTVTVQPGIADNLVLTPAGVAAATPEPGAQQPAPAQVGPQAGGGGGFPVAVVILGLAAAGGGAFFLTQSSSTSEPPPPPPATTGGIRIIVTIP